MSDGFDAVRCATHDYDLNEIKNSLGELKKKIAGNGQHGIELRLHDVEAALKQLIEAQATRAEAEKARAEKKDYWVLKTILQTAAIVAAFLLTKYLG